jgi:hypothetical protein
VSSAKSNFLTDYHDRVEQAADALWKDVTTPLSTTEQVTSGMFGGGMRGIKTASDALDYVASPVSALFDSGPGRAAEALSGGRIPRQTAGNVAMMALPVAGEVVTEAKLAEAAKAAGVSVDTLRANLEARAAATRAGQDVSSAKAKAARRLLTQGKLKPGEARGAAAEHRAVGAGDPRLLDVMETPAQRVVRHAGVKAGDADTTLEDHRRATRADVSGRATQRTEALSPYSEGVEERKAALKTQRDALASTQYREPYAQPIQSDDRMFDVLNSPAAFNAMADAAATARERALTDPSAAQQFHEITSLRDYFAKKAAYEQAAETWQAKAKLRELGWKPTPKPEPPPMPTVSGGTLDRIRISLRDKADTLSQAGRRGRAGGVGDRGRALDEYLDSVPHLKEARAAYADYSKRMEQLDFDRNLSTMRPESFKAMLKDLTPEQRQELVHSVSERLASKFGSSGRSAQGTEDILTTGYNAQANLRELLGDDVASDYLRAIDLLGQNVDKANFVASRTGSQTAMIKTDAAETGVKASFSILTGRHHAAVHHVATFLFRHLSGMGEAEARQIAEWATQQKSVASTLQEITEAAASGGGKKAGVNLPPDIRALIPVGAIAEANPPKPADAASGENPYAKFATPKAPAPAKGDTPAPPDLTKASYESGDLPAPSADLTGLLSTVRKLEGSGDSAVSPKGAIGRYQITPPTAEKYGLDVSRLKDPEYSERAASRILADLSRQFHGDEAAILVAYNAGPDRASRWIAAGRDPSALPHETRKYLFHAGLGDDPGDAPAGEGRASEGRSPAFTGSVADYVPAISP